MAAEEDRGSYNIEGREDALEVNEDAFLLWETAAGTSLDKKTHLMTGKRRCLFSLGDGCGDLTGEENSCDDGGSLPFI